MSARCYRRTWANEVAELEVKIEEIEGSWLFTERRADQDTALDEAIGLADRVVALRVEYQGNSREHVRWRHADGGPREWHEVAAARHVLAKLRLYRELEYENRHALLDITSPTEIWRLYSQAKFDETITAIRQNIEIRHRILGAEHPDVLNSIYNLGFTLQAQGKLTEAEPHLREAHEIRRRVLGRDHPDTLASINNIGALLLAQGKLSEAEPYYREALEGLRRVLGVYHRYTLFSIGNLGLLLQAQGKLSVAVPYLHEALQICRRVFGDEDRPTLVSVNSMGGLLMSLGKLSEAEPYFREVVKGRRRVHGTEHPLTLESVNNLGGLLFRQGKLPEAKPYLLEALNGRRNMFGNVNLYTLQAVSNMGKLLRAQGKFSEAEPCFREALAIAENLRVDIIGYAQDRDHMAKSVNLSWITSCYSHTLLVLEREAMSLSAFEQGRSRAALDLLNQDEKSLVESLQAIEDPKRIARYESSLASERLALNALRESEAHLAAAPEYEKSKWVEEIKPRRRELS